jgi:hypothetical protein
MTRLSRVNLSLMGDDSEEEGDVEKGLMLKSFVKSGMVDMMKVSLHRPCYVLTLSNILYRMLRPTFS